MGSSPKQLKEGERAGVLSQSPFERSAYDFCKEIGEFPVKQVPATDSFTSDNGCLRICLTRTESHLSLGLYGPSHTYHWDCMDRVTPITGIVWTESHLSLGLYGPSHIYHWDCMDRVTSITGIVWTKSRLSLGLYGSSHVYHWDCIDLE